MQRLVIIIAVLCLALVKASKSKLSSVSSRSSEPSHRSPSDDFSRDRPHVLIDRGLQDVTTKQRTGDRATVVIAGLAFAVSLLSLMLTAISMSADFDLKRQDVSVKEQSIIPDLTLVKTNLKVLLSSTGIGPAHVKYIILHADGKCIDEEEHFDASLLKWYDKINENFVEEINKNTSKDAFKAYTVVMRRTTFSEDFYLLAGNNKDLFEFSVRGGRSADGSREGDPNVEDLARNVFDPVWAKFGMRIGYCSYTDKNCYDMDVGTTPECVDERSSRFGFLKQAYRKIDLAALR